jgi:hypothetical protein
MLAIMVAPVANVDFKGNAPALEREVNANISTSKVFLT